MGRTLVGVLLGALLVPASLLVWLHFGKVPVAVADPLLFHERELTHVPLNARIHREMLPVPPAIQPNEETFVAAAEIYRDQCATCHGFHGKPSSFAKHMFPKAPQLWEKHNQSAVVGVSDDPPGESYWKIANGIRLTGMPAYKGILSDKEMWEVALLVANADKPLPPAAVGILHGITPPTIIAAPETKKK